jgi:hypothetical protein
LSRTLGLLWLHGISPSTVVRAMHGDATAVAPHETVIVSYTQLSSVQSRTAQGRSLSSAAYGFSSELYHYSYIHDDRPQVSRSTRTHTAQISYANPNKYVFRHILRFYFAFTTFKHEQHSDSTLGEQQQGTSPSPKVRAHSHTTLPHTAQSAEPGRRSAFTILDSASRRQRPVAPNLRASTPIQNTVSAPPAPSH